MTDRTRCQQSELYQAEERALRVLSARWGPIARTARMHMTVDEAQRLVDDLRETDWFAHYFPAVRYVEVKSDGRWRGSVGAYLGDGYGVCEMDPVHLNGLFVCHELSHVLTAARYGQNAHGPWFCRTYLQVVYHALGSDVYKVLYDELERDHIDHRIDE